MKRIFNNAISLAVVIIVLFLVIPLPAPALDVLIVINISLSIMILMITMSISEALEFSIFPSLLLVTTLFRLGLNVSSTRLILSNGGQAGVVISAFGNLITQGNIVIGVLIFLIIVLVQFIVITKGAERVSEVAARFTLDAMPGKQMAIDADLSSGLIDEKEARMRRYKIQKEADFYGAMDGATKIVKGDAIMSLIITLINFVAGIIIGMVQGDSDIQTVLSVYSIATIGDGLVSQLPSLMISTATGMIVTRSVSDGSLNTVDPEEVPVGAVIVVRPGERVPLDGAVLSGESSLNTSALTGESVPRTVRPGDEVISGCVNGDGLLRIEVRKPYGESTVAKILDLVENSSLKKARAENFITKFARYYTPAVCIAALALAVIPPLFVGGWMVWFTRALTFLVISCPCALVISIPLTFFGGIGGASRQGVLIKGGNYLEALAHTETAVFDKTGTLTRGIFAVERVRPAGDYAEAQVIELAAQAESYSNHPISKSLRAACAEQPDPKRTSDVQEIAGQGIRASVDGHAVAVGNARLMEALGIAYIPDDGVGTVVYVACDGAFLGSILIADEVKPTAAAAVSALKKQGVRTVMLTGDAPAVAEHVAAELGMDEVHAGLLPGDKVEQVEALLAAKRPGSSLAFVGDGINDAPVLMRADVGIAMGALGSDAAIEAADVVLMDDDPAKLSDAMRLARKCMRIVYENIIFALGIKFAFLILGAVGIATMWWAVFADVGVMVLAVLNAMRMLSVPKKH